MQFASISTTSTTSVRLLGATRRAIRFVKRWQSSSCSLVPLSAAKCSQRKEPSPKERRNDHHYRRKMDFQNALEDRWRNLLSHILFCGLANLRAVGLSLY